MCTVCDDVYKQWKSVLSLVECSGKYINLEKDLKRVYCWMNDRNILKIHIVDIRHFQVSFNKLSNTRHISKPKRFLPKFLYS